MSAPAVSPASAVDQDLSQAPSAGTSPRPDPAADAGLYGPDSVTWRVMADPSMALAGIRALLLQTLHPLAMAGVAQHSDFNQDPWGRLFRTADYVGVTTFGTTEQARRAGARVRGIHRRLRGVERETGTPYRVDDPDLLLWVHCAEVESFLSTAVRCGLPLTREEQDRYYGEQAEGAALVGLDPDAVPGSVEEVADYFASVRPRLRATAEARRGARFVLWPPMPALVQLGTPARPAWTVLATTAFGLLPRWARQLYALPGLPAVDLAATGVGSALRRGLLVVPPGLRQGPHLAAAQERLGLA